MKLRVLNCEKIENGKYSVEIEYTEGSERFYPDGKGGQIGDLGKVGEAKILVSQEKNLVLDRELIPGEYCYEIDGERRRDAEENHSGEHLFSALAFLKYGWRTVGFKMSEKYCTLDFDRNDMTPEMIAQLEGDVNTKICE
ncbi:MAG: alanyl-tRNA editing protein, partial [Fusobacteriaceae bacterium]